MQIFGPRPLSSKKKTITMTIYVKIYVGLASVYIFGAYGVENLQKGYLFVLYCITNSLWRDSSKSIDLYPFVANVDSRNPVNVA